MDPNQTNNPVGQPGEAQTTGDSAQVPATPAEGIPVQSPAPVTDPVADPAAQQPIYQDPNAMTNIGQPAGVQPEPAASEPSGNEPPGGGVPPVPNTAI